MGVSHRISNAPLDIQWAIGFPMVCRPLEIQWVSTLDAIGNLMGCFFISGGVGFSMGYEKSNGVWDFNGPIGFPRGDFKYKQKSCVLVKQLN